MIYFKAKIFPLRQDRDPFFESPESEVPIGTVHVFLQSLAYMVEIDEQLPITDFKGNERGQLKVALMPCSPQGKEITGEFVDQPEELVRTHLSLLLLYKNNIFVLTGWKKFELQSKNSKRFRFAKEIYFGNIFIP